MTLVALFWQRLERRWDENPGYVAAATAGTIGIVLALILIVNAGIDWYNAGPDDPSDDFAASEMADDLGEPDDNVMRGLLDDNDEPPVQVARRSEDPDDQLDGDDPFLKPRKFDRRQLIVKDEDDDEPDTREPDDFQPNPKIDLSQVEIKIEEAASDNEMPLDEEADLVDVTPRAPTSEPVLLKTNAEREDTGWQQQSTRIEPPAVAARRSQASETVVIAPREVAAAPREVSPPRRTVAPPEPRAVGTPGKTEVDALKLSISGPAKVALGEPCRYELSLKNTGATTVRNLVVSIELPRGLVHEVSQSLEQEVASVAPGGIHRSLLVLRAKHPGENVIQADIVSGRRVAVQLTARVQVGPTAAAPRVVMSDCLCDDLR